MYSRLPRQTLSRFLPSRLSTAVQKISSTSRTTKTPSIIPTPTPRLPNTSTLATLPIKTSPTSHSRKMSASNEPFLIRFFHPTIASPDPRGRTLATILSWSDSNLERSHNYIQTVFPLPEGSMFQGAPLITPQIRDAFLSQPALRASLHAALERMLSFYGLQFTQSQPEHDGTEPVEEVTRGPNFASNSRNWVTRFNHNHLRMTRILRSLRVLGLDSDAAALHRFLATDEVITSCVSSRSQMYWRRAAERALRLPPDEDDDSAEGIEWLHVD